MTRDCIQLRGQFTGFTGGNDESHDSEGAAIVVENIGIDEEHILISPDPDSAAAIAGPKTGGTDARDAIHG